MSTTRKEHRVIETTASGRMVWKSAPGSKVAFYASAQHSCEGALELSIAAVEAFKLKGEDLVFVLEAREDEGYQVGNIVDARSPDFWRALIAKYAADRAEQVAA